MQRPRHPEWFLILAVLGIIAVVPLVQIVEEARRGERPQAFAVFDRRPTAANLRTYEHGIEDASWAAKRLRPLAQYVQMAWLKDGGDQVVVGRDGWLFYRPGLDYLTQRPAADEREGGVAKAVAAIVDFRDQLAARGVWLLVMPTPNKESVYPERVTHRAANLRRVPCAQTQTLLQGLKDAGVEVVNLFELFATAKTNETDPQEPLYLAQDSHWSPRGVAWAARAVAQRVREHHGVRPGRVTYASRPAPVQQLGDILRMLQLPQLEREFAAESIPCRQVVRPGDGQPYQDDPASEILVLGDSFLRIYEQDEPGAAGFIAHLARELSQPLASIVNDGGASTLVRQELHRRPALLRNKKVVLWEFVERDIRFGTEGWQKVPLPPEAN